MRSTKSANTRAASRTAVAVADVCKGRTMSLSCHSIVGPNGLLKHNRCLQAHFHAAHCQVPHEILWLSVY